MKKFYVILGQTTDAQKYPVVYQGWNKNKKDAVKNFKDEQTIIPCEPIYGTTYTFYEFIKGYILNIRLEKSGILLKDLK